VGRDLCSIIKTSAVNKIPTWMTIRPPPAAPAEIEETASANAQLTSWMTDDAEEAWKKKKEYHDAKLQQIEEARADFWASAEEENINAGALETGDVAIPF